MTPPRQPAPLPSAPRMIGGALLGTVLLANALVFWTCVRHYRRARRTGL